MAPTPALALHGLWWVVSEPPLTPLDQNFALRHASIIHPALTPQGNPYWVTFRVFRVTGLRVIGADRDRNRLALSGFYDGQTVRLDFGHIDRVLSARVATGFLAPAHGLGRDLPAARHGAPAASPFSASRAPLRLVDGLPRGFLGSTLDRRARLRKFRSARGKRRAGFFQNNLGRGLCRCTDHCVACNGTT